MNLLKFKWLAVVIIAGIGWLGLSIIKIKLQDNVVGEEVAGLELKIDNTEKNNNILEKFLEYVKYPSFLEKEARLKLNYKVPGEEVVFVYPDSSVKSSGSLDFQKQLAQMPNYIKWVYYLLGY